MSQPPNFRTVAAAALVVGRCFGGPRVADSADLTRIRSAMLERVIDCEIKTVRRIRMQLAGATTAVPKELTCRPRATPR